MPALITWENYQLEIIKIMRFGDRQGLDEGREAKIQSRPDRSSSSWSIWKEGKGLLGGFHAPEGSGWQLGRTSVKAGKDISANSFSFFGDCLPYDRHFGTERHRGGNFGNIFMTCSEVFSRFALRSAPALLEPPLSMQKE